MTMQHGSDLISRIQPRSAQPSPRGLEYAKGIPTKEIGVQDKCPRVINVDLGDIRVTTIQMSHSTELYHELFEQDCIVISITMPSNCSTDLLCKLDSYDLSRTVAKVFTHQNIEKMSAQIGRNSLTIIIPKEHFKAKSGRLGGREFLQLPSDSSASRVAIRYLALVLPEIDKFDAQVMMFIGKHLSDLFIEAINICSGSVLSTSESNSTSMTKIKDYIERELDNCDLTPVSIAKSLGFSVRYLHKLFESEGITLVQYILRRRLEKCAQMLSEKNASTFSITRIAFDNGFKNTSHFSKTFKKVYGISPSLYRRENLNHDN